MNIRGIQKFSLIDYPGKMACVIFVGNCNCRCPYCHNPCLVFDPDSQPQISEDEVLDFLHTRVGKLDGIVISGGEPCLRHGLKEFVRKIKKMGFLIKLDTNGSFPKKVRECFEEGLIDALGVDYKAPTHMYNHVAGSSVSDFAEKVHEVISFAIHKKLYIDVRTTVHKKILSSEHLSTMRNELNRLGVTKWTLQQFNPVEVIDDKLLNEPTYSDVELLRIAESLGNGTRVRGLKGVFADSM